MYRPRNARMHHKSHSTLHHLISSNVAKEKKRFTQGYHYIYRIVEQQIEKQIRRNPILVQASVVVPHYAQGNIVIPMEEGKKYVRKQLQKGGIHIVQEDGVDRMLVSWASLTNLSSSLGGRSHPILVTKQKASAVIEIQSSSSSSSSPSPEPQPSAKRKKLTGKVSKRDPDSEPELPEDVERQIQELHHLVLRAASGC